jgi:hypothetical protein
MGLKPRIPTALARGPITLEDARRSGLERWHLQTSVWRRVGPHTYVAESVKDTPLMRIAAASRRLPAKAAFSGFMAGWLHGLDAEPCNPIEITVAAPTTVSTRAGMKVRRRQLDEGDIVDVRGFHATSILRTLGDICPRLSLTEAVVVADMALHAQLTNLEAIRTVRGLRRIVEHVEPASESPMETRLRMLVVLGGLPRPAAQVEIRDRWFRFAGRPDLYYPEHRLGLEYDGAGHREALIEDNRRQNRLLDAGVRLLRFTAGDIYDRPDAVIRLIRTALAA